MEEIINVDNQKKIRNFIVEASGFDDFTNEKNIFEAGIVNSLFSIQLVTFLENTFKIKVTVDDLDFKNFESVVQINEFVTRKIALCDA